MTKLAFVTGASAGIGTALAHELHTDGYNLVLTARRKDRLEELSAKLNAIRADSAYYLVADLANDTTELESYIKSNRIDLLVNNAGFGSFGEFSELRGEREDEMVRTNISATLKLTKSVLPQMITRGSGQIINVSSITAFQPLPYMATYAATKAFNFYHSMALREELRSKGITVLALCPGPTATEFRRSAEIAGELPGGPSEDPKMVAREALKALKRGAPWIVPGLKAKAYALVSDLLPLSLRMKICTRIMKAGF